MRALKIIALPSVASSGRASCCRYTGSADFSIMTGAARAAKAARAARAAGAAGATGAANGLGIPIKLGFSSLLFLIGTSAFLRYSDWHGCIGLLTFIFNI